MRNKILFCLIFLTSLTQANQNSSLEEITIQAFPLSNEISTDLSNNPTPSADSAEVLKRMPGANANGNGPITGIAQYRGMFGDRISVKLDSAPTLTGGPNAMDTPLSYAPSGLLSDLIIYRGITPVSQAQESIGGHMVAKLNRGSFIQSQELNTSGYAVFQQNNNGQQANTDVQLVNANNQHKISLLGSYNEGDDFSAGDNKTVTGTQYQRERYDLAYGLKTSTNELLIFAGRHNVANSGTPALAMDIINVNTDMAGLNLSSDLANNSVFSKLNLAIAWANVNHGMDNHSLRKQPPMTMKYRHNQADAENLSWSLDTLLPLTASELKLGIDSNRQSHDSLITNPTNDHFKVKNFVDSERDSLGVFAELSGNHHSWDYQVGYRHNRIELNSAKVGAMGMMGSDMSGMGHMDMDMGMGMGMGMNNNVCSTMHDCANELANAFNQADRTLNHNTNNLVIKLNRALDKETVLSIDLGVKQRAPSYRETYLWVPLSITGGLADGRNYVGNLNLKPETSREINLGLSKNKANFSIQPQIFYRQIDNYIQGTPSTDSAVNSLSNLMAGSPALAYSNTNAEIYGLDTNWNLSINNQWSADGVVSYVRGKRTDVKDNLYRIAPTNARISVNYQSAKLPLEISVESIIYARQKHVASYANESQTAGYGIVNLSAKWTVNNALQVHSGITNLFDRYYANHLNSVNRNGGSDIAVGEVIPGMGRTLYVQAKVEF
ncbi:TonB-dependent receptor [Porticoccaceae bacterium]|nr:TonB-dependent receptor [Porticoccaceae bacterium]